MNPKIAVLILAAGTSKRMGEPKQLLAWKNTTLLGNCIEEALMTGLKEVYVVIGANANQITPELEKYPVSTVLNKNWKAGLGNSIGSGVKYILGKKKVDSILILLADQPFVKASDLKLLIEKTNKNPKTIVASKFKDLKEAGVPIIFNAAYFHELSELNTEKGAKSILKKYYDLVTEVSIDVVFGDVDTKSQYRDSLKIYNQKK